MAMPTEASLALLNHLHTPTTCCAARPATSKGSLKAICLCCEAILFCHMPPPVLYVCLYYEGIRPASQGLMLGKYQGCITSLTHLLMAAAGTML